MTDLIARFGVLRVIKLTKAGGSDTTGLLVQWNCHPESLGSRNLELTADFPWATVAALKKDGVRCRVLTPAQMEKAGMNGVLAVGSGSRVEPRFLVAEQLRDIDMPPGLHVLEPIPRNTAPAIAAAAW